MDEQSGSVIAHFDYNVAYLPLPNRVEIIVSDHLAPFELTKTAFLLPFFDDGDVLLAHHQRRGLEVPGGHIEAGETLIEAAVRECYEEVGCSVKNVRPVGYLKMISDGSIPEGWRYPHPISYQQFFIGQIASVRPYASNDECAPPVKIRDFKDERIRHSAIRVYGEIGRSLIG